MRNDGKEKSVDQGLFYGHWKGAVIRLDRVRTSFAKELTVAQLNDIMIQFRDELVELGEVEITKGKKVTTYRWTKGRATVLANHIFVGMLGGIKDRILFGDDLPGSELSKAYSMWLKNWAKEAAADNSLPPLISTLFQGIAKTMQFETQADVPCASMVWQWHQHKLSELYEELKLRVQVQDEELLKYFETQIGAVSQKTPRAIVDEYLAGAPLLKKLRPLSPSFRKQKGSGICMEGDGL